MKMNLNFRLFQPSERVYKIPYLEDSQIAQIEHRLAELSGIYRPPSRISGIGGSQDDFANVTIMHSWPTRQPPYIQMSYNPLQDSTKVLTIRSNVVTEEMVQEVEKALGLRKTA